MKDIAAVLRLIFVYELALLFAGCSTQRTAQPFPIPNANQPAGASSWSSDLTGVWAGQARDKTTIAYRFQKDGTVIWFVGEPNIKKQFPPGLRAKFTIRETAPVWEIDIHDFEDSRFSGVIFQGIIQPLDNRRFRMEGVPSNRGPRPTAFSTNAVEFSKQGPA